MMMSEQGLSICVVTLNETRKINLLNPHPFLGPSPSSNYEKGWRRVFTSHFIVSKIAIGFSLMVIITVSHYYSGLVPCYLLRPIMKNLYWSYWSIKYWLCLQFLFNSSAHYIVQVFFSTVDLSLWQRSSSTFRFKHHMVENRYSNKERQIY